ncbi:Tetratricopeptide repeat containing protein [Gracilaria domingensis]|nr:Tetratricopeptide repeat containing protein [Gracilaria domingensis]
MQFHLKGCSYKNVPQSDRCFEAKQYDDEDDSDEEYVTPAERGEPPVLVAVRSYGDGFVSYYGDVNCELPTTKLISAFVTVPRKRPPCSWDAERNVNRAMQAKENGNKAFREGNFRHALSFYNEAQKHLDPIANRRKQECSKVLGNIAECRLKLNQWPEAIEASTKALELDPSNVKGHYRRARAHLMAARDDINALKKHGNVQAPAISHLHDLSVKLSEYALLESEAPAEPNGSSSGKRSIGLLSKSASELRELGNEKFKSKMYDFAISYYEAALVVGPSNDSDHVKILCNLSLCYNRKEDWPLAVKTANDALEINPNAEKALLRRAQAYVRMDKGKEAKADLKRLESLPGVPKRELRALSDELKNVTDDGEEQQESSSRNGPSGPPINVSMESITQYHVDRPRNAWSSKLGQRERYEWLADCYRMRVDDEYSYMDDVRSGSIYDPGHSADSIMVDFLIFCKLAVARDVLPSEWDWSEFLNLAANNLKFTFGKADAQEKYGVENFFNGFLESGRSLRFTAKEIYISDFTKPDEDNEFYESMSQRVKAQFYGNSDVFVFNNAGTMFAEVGGRSVWNRFWRQIEQRLR